MLGHIENPIMWNEKLANKFLREAPVKREAQGLDDLDKAAIREGNAVKTLGKDKPGVLPGFLIPSIQADPVGLTVKA